MPGTSGIILAGGKSRRMCRDKATLSVDGQTLLQRTSFTLGMVTEEILIVGLQDSASIPAHTRAIDDATAGAGPLGGLVAGLQAMGNLQAVAVACDLPLLDAALLRYLIGLAPGHDAVIPRIGGRIQPLHAVYASSVFAPASAQLAAGHYRLQDLLNKLHVRWVEEADLRAEGYDLRSFANVNTPQDWEAALRTLREA